jgi:hypothetical protein
MNFRASFCEPSNPKIMELNVTTVTEITTFFEQIPWAEFLREMAETPAENIHYSPSLEIENKLNKNGISISVAGEPNDYEFYIFYKRPKRIKRLFGLFETLDANYLTEIHGQRHKDAVACLNALLSNDLEYLEAKIGA